MAQSRPSVLKRQRERAKMEKRREKLEKRAAREQAREETADEVLDVGGDPDIAHIVPGPQRQPWMEDDEAEE